MSNWAAMKAKAIVTHPKFVNAWRQKQDQWYLQKTFSHARNVLLRETIVRVFVVWMAAGAWWSFTGGGEMVKYCGVLNMYKTKWQMVISSRCTYYWNIVLFTFSKNLRKNLLLIFFVEFICMVWYMAINYYAKNLINSFVSNAILSNSWYNKTMNKNGSWSEIVFQIICLRETRHPFY